MVAFGWVALIAGAVAVELFIWLRQMRQEAAARGSGGIAAMGFGLGMEPRGWFFLLGPPLAIIVLRLYAGMSRRKYTART